jgi:hypothetical protein
MTDILRCDEDLIAWMTDCGCTCREDNVGVQGIGRGRWYAKLSGVRPEESGLTPSGGRYGLIRQSSSGNQIIEAVEGPRCVDPGELATHFEVCDLSHDDFDGPCYERIDPKPALVGQNCPWAPTGMAQRAGIQQNELAHRLVTSLEDRPIRTSFINRSHPFLIRRIIGFIGDFRDFTQTPSGRLQAFRSLFLGLLLKCPVRSQARWREGPYRRSSRFRLCHHKNLRCCGNP